MIKIIDILHFLKEANIPYEYYGKMEIVFNSFCALNSLKANSITWAGSLEKVDIDELNKIEGLVLVAEKGDAIDNAAFSIVYVENVRRTYFRIVSKFFGHMDQENREKIIEATAVVETKMIGQNVYVGHHSYVGPEVILGNNVEILYNVSIQGKVVIGDFTKIESGTVIGAVGFGYYKDEEGNPIAIPHLGRVVIGSHVTIGANNTISRGCLADTVIEDYVKTDNLCHIAHNDHIGKRTMLAAGVVISGSTTIEENVWLAPGTLVIDGVCIENNAFTGIGAVVTKNVSKGKVVAGIPAKTLRDRYD